MKDKNADVTIDIDMDKKCRKCGHPGAANNGICLTCASKSIGTPSNGQQIKRLLQLLRDLDTLEEQKKVWLDEWHADFKSVVRNLQSTRQEIESGQTNMFEGKS